MSDTTGLAAPRAIPDAERQAIDATGPIATITIDIRGADAEIDTIDAINTIDTIGTTARPRPIGAIARIGIFAHTIVTSITSIGRPTRDAAA